MDNKDKLYFSMRVYGKGIGPQKSGKFTDLGLKYLGVKMRLEGQKFQEKKTMCAKALGNK